MLQLMSCAVCRNALQFNLIFLELPDSNCPETGVYLCKDYLFSLQGYAVRSFNSISERYRAFACDKLTLMTKVELFPYLRGHYQWLPVIPFSPVPVYPEALRVTIKIFFRIIKG
jgi:hypothetical protein